MNVLGLHLLLELRECNPKLLDDLDFVREAMLRAAHNVGAHIVGPSAGELIHEYVLAMKKKMTKFELAETIHAYPTLSEGPRYAALAYVEQQIASGFLGKAARLGVRVERALDSGRRRRVR